MRPLTPEERMERAAERAAWEARRARGCEGCGISEGTLVGFEGVAGLWCAGCDPDDTEGDDAMTMTDAERAEIDARMDVFRRERYAPGSVVMTMTPKFKTGDRVVIDTSFSGPVPGVVRKTRGADGIIAFDAVHVDTIGGVSRATSETSYQWSERGFRGSSYVALLGPVRFEHEPAAPESEWLVRARAELAAANATAKL